MFHEKVEHTLKAKNDLLPDVSMKRGQDTDGKYTGSYFDPRFQKEHKSMDCDVMSNITNWSMIIRDALLSIERVLQIPAYENIQKRDTPTNLSTDLLLVQRMLSRGIRSKDILGTKVERVCAILT